MVAARVAIGVCLELGVQPDEEDSLGVIVRVSRQRCAINPAEQMTHIEVYEGVAQPRRVVVILISE